MVMDGGAAHPESRSLRPFIELTRRLLGSTSLERSLTLVCDAALAILPGEHASVRVLDGSETRLLCGARAGEGLDHRPMRFQQGSGIAGWVVDHGEAAHIDDTSRDPRFVAVRASEQGFSIRSLLAAPLWSGDRAVGVLGVTSRHVAAFQEDDELVLALLANCASPSLERARLERLAITDPLTLAFNHRYLAPRLQEELARAGRRGDPLSVLLMDLDHFKAVNDDHGHAAGDRVLRGFTERLRGLVRVSDVLVRRGGEEFLLVMPEMGEAAAMGVAERIRECVAEQPFSLDEGGERSRTQTVSIGVAVWDGQRDAEALEAQADEAMYRAKRAGRNLVVMASEGAD